jgi:hypothetical protein
MKIEVIKGLPVGSPKAVITITKDLAKKMKIAFRAINIEKDANAIEIGGGEVRTSDVASVITIACRDASFDRFTTMLDLSSYVGAEVLIYDEGTAVVCNGKYHTKITSTHSSVSLYRPTPDELDEVIPIPGAIETGDIVLNSKEFFDALKPFYAIFKHDYRWGQIHFEFENGALQLYWSGGPDKVERYLWLSKDLSGYMLLPTRYIWVLRSVFGETFTLSFNQLPLTAKHGQAVTIKSAGLDLFLVKLITKSLF